MPDNQDARDALLRAAEDLLEGRVPGPLTGLRLVEVAGVKRHRLTHDNPDINADFQRRAREQNRTKPEVESLRKKLQAETERNSALIAEREELRARANKYASALLIVTDERDNLLRLLADGSNVTPLPRA